MKVVKENVLACLKASRISGGWAKDIAHCPKGLGITIAAHGRGTYPAVAHVCLYRAGAGIVGVQVHMYQSPVTVGFLSLEEDPLSFVFQVFDLKGYECDYEGYLRSAVNHLTNVCS